MWGRIGGHIRVLLSGDTTSDVQVVARPGTKVKSLDRRRTWRIPSNKGAKKWRLEGRGSTTLVQFTKGRQGKGRRGKKGAGWRTWKRFRGEAEFSSTTGKLTLVLPGKRATYRGRLRSSSPRAGAGRDTVNVVSLEAYLRGVVPLEVPALWAPAAVSAQSVAARTYAAAERAHPNAAHYDLCDTAHCQVYGGYDSEHDASDTAIRATSRTGVLHDGRPAFTQFSSSNGGWSADGSKPYLVARQDPYDDWSGNPVHTWTYTLDDAGIEKHWPAVGDLTAIEIVSRDGNGEWGGRVQNMILIGTDGQVTITGDDLRLALGLRSEWFTLSVGPKQAPRVTS